MRVKLTKKHLEILDRVFKNAPKTYEESLLQGILPPIPPGTKYADFENESRLLNEILDRHDSELCSCTLGEPCYYELYSQNKITVSEILDEIKNK